MKPTIQTEPLTAKEFTPFGDVLDTSGDPDFLINQGLCGRFHDRANLDFSGGASGVSLFKARPRSFPYKLDIMERHPLGSQAFIPMYITRFLIIVAPDQNGTPGIPRAFLTNPGQAINLHIGVWHGVLTPLEDPGLFAVVDRIGDGNNLEEHWFDTAWIVVESIKF